MILKIDWYFVRRTLIFFGATVLLSVGLVFFGLQLEKMNYENYKQGESNLRTTHQLYENMVNDIDLLEQYTSEFNEFKDSGLVGGERRLSWIESLDATNSVLKLPQLTYTLLPREGYTREGLNPGRGVELSSSPMELSIGMLHEEDLFALLEGLGMSISTLFTVDSCIIRLLGVPGKSLDTRKANLNANCVVRWINIDVK